MSPPRIALIGYGEVGQMLARNLDASGHGPVAAWDRLFPDVSSIPSRALAAAQGVTAGANLCTAIEGATLVISAVTAGECVAAAREAATGLAPGAWYVDLNSVSPGTRREAAQLVEATGARYVEAAVMSPIAPKGIGSPMLLGGPHAGAFVDVARELGFAGAELYAAEIGRASAAKMCRSVMIKGLEALLTESLLAARRHGVERTVLDSLANLLPVADWETLAHYMISRSLQHGRRRAEEMREVARTVREAGLEPWMSTACAERQDWAAGHAHALVESRLQDMLDAVLGQAAARTETQA